MKSSTVKGISSLSAPVTKLQTTVIVKLNEPEINNLRNLAVLHEHEITSYLNKVGGDRIIEEQLRIFQSAIEKLEQGALAF